MQAERIRPIVEVSKLARDGRFDYFLVESTGALGAAARRGVVGAGLLLIARAPGSEDVGLHRRLSRDHMDLSIRQLVEAWQIMCTSGTRALELSSRLHGERPTVLDGTDAGRPIYERMGYATSPRTPSSWRKRCSAATDRGCDPRVRGPIRSTNARLLLLVERHALDSLSFGVFALRRGCPCFPVTGHDDGLSGRHFPTLFVSDSRGL